MQIKFLFLEHPMLYAVSADPSEKDVQLKILTYAGSFNKGIREPDFMLQVLAKLEISVECNIYAVGNCSEVLFAYAKNILLSFIFTAALQRRRQIKRSLNPIIFSV